MRRLHPRRQIGFCFRPHQIDVTEFATQIERRWGIPAKIEKWPTILLIGARRVGGQTFKLIDFALMIDFILRPSLFQDLHHLARPVIAIGAVLGLARKIGTDDIDCETAFQHVIQCRQRARQHDGLHLAAPHRRQQIDLVRQRRTTGNK